MRSNDEIINLLNTLKEQQNLSISEIARRVGMAKSAVSRYFNKTREFPLNRAESFANAFGISQEYLLGLDSKNFTQNMSQKKIPVEQDIIEEKESYPILNIYKRLNDERKEKVFDYAQYQLDEQTKKSLPIITEEIDTLAAHSKNPNKEYTQEEIDDIKAYLDQLSEEYDKKHK
ncbi:MAG: helix-turn-helix domain-containing protein [Enterococcus sp.]